MAIYKKEVIFLKYWNNGIEKEIDNLGRVVLPMSYRKKLGLDKNPRVNLCISKDSICITAVSNICVICKTKEYCDSNLKVCTDCVRMIKEFSEPKPE